jgi:hypothetical protein
MDSERFIITLSRVKRLLEKYQVGYARVVTDLMTKLEDRPDLLKEELLGIFSGMCGLTDIYICKDNGHQVEREQETNFELRSLLSALYEEVKYSVHGEAANRQITHFWTYPTTREEWEEKLLAEDLRIVFDVLVWITYYHSDWRWVQDWCLHFTDHPNPYLRGLAATCLADLAGLHKSLDTGKVIPRLQQLLNDSDVEVRERAEEALREINAELKIFS